MLLGWVSSKDEGLATSDDLEGSGLANGAIESEGNLSGLLGLSLQDGLGLTSETLLLGSISSVALGGLLILTLLILSNPMSGVFLELLAVSHLEFGSVHLSQVEIKS